MLQLLLPLLLLRRRAREGRALRAVRVRSLVVIEMAQIGHRGGERGGAPAGKPRGVAADAEIEDRLLNIRERHVTRRIVDGAELVNRSRSRSRDVSRSRDIRRVDRGHGGGVTLMILLISLMMAAISLAQHLAKPFGPERRVVRAHLSAHHPAPRDGVPVGKRGHAP